MIPRLFTRFLSFKNTPFFERYFTVIVFIAALITTSISMVIGLQQSVWFDEGYSIMVAQQPVSELFALTSADAHPPLYYLLLKGWMILFGSSEFALRLSSVVCGGLSVIVMGFLLKDLFNRRIALIALPVVVFAPFLLRYNYEIRMYSFVMLIGLLATWVMFRAWQTKQAKWWLVYGALVALGMYTLYMSAVFWLAHIVWLSFMAYQMKQHLLKQPYLLAYIGAGIAFLPWVPTVFSQLSSSALPPFMSTMTLYELTNILGLMMTYTAGWQIGPWLSIALLVFIVTFAVVFVKVWHKVTKRERESLLLLAACFVIGIIFYAAISLPPNPSRFMDRYVVHISIFWYATVGVIIALGLREKIKVPTYVLAAITVCLLGLGVATNAQVGNFNFQRVQYFQAETIRQELGCDDTTYVTAGPFGYIDMKYHFQGCPLKYYYPWDVTLTGGFAPVDKSADRIKTTTDITSSRLVYVYFDDSDVTLTPDTRYHEIERRSFDKTRIIIYER